MSTDIEAADEWFAIRTRQVARAEAELRPVCREVLSLKEVVRVPGGKDRMRAVIPHVLFVRTDSQVLLDKEREGREKPESAVQFWIYRYPQDNRIRAIPESAIHLLRLLTADDTTKCEIFSKKDFREHQHVRVTGGRFEGYEGSVVRVKKNKHVVVKIEGVCMVLLPFIHPDFLAPIDNPSD